MSRRSIPVVWRDAIGDSDLDSTAKLVAYQLTRWMNGRGVCFPSREEIAAKASLSVRAVELAISRLEADGWLQIERSRGRRSHRYCAALPPTANEIRRSEWPTANERPSNGERRSSNGERRSPEDVVRRRKRAAPTADALSGASSGPQSNEGRGFPEGECERCRRVRALVDADAHFCADCLEPVENGACRGCAEHGTLSAEGYCADCQSAVDAIRGEGPLDQRPFGYRPKAKRGVSHTRMRQEAR
jgi:hypothetical protein